MTDRDSIGDSTGSTSQAKRKIPAVTEVVETIIRRRPVAAGDRPALFQAAQHVCTEEIRLVRTGFAPATVVELADRAEKLLGRREPGRMPIARWDDNEPFGDLTVASGSTRRRPELAEELWPAKSEPARPIRLPESEPLPDTETVRTAAPTPVPARPERPIVSSPVPHASRVPIFMLTFLIIGAAAGYFFWNGRRVRRVPRSIGESRAAPRPQTMREKPILDTTLSAPAAVAAKPLKRSAPPAPPAPVAEAPSTETTPANQSRAGTMRSADWSGAPAFVLHCSSYRKRENAERDAARLSRVYGHPSHVLGVDLGGEGHWFRVVLGDFAKAGDAFAFRQKLLDEKAPEVGLIYQVMPAADGR